MKSTLECGFHRKIKSASLRILNLKPGGYVIVLIEATLNRGFQTKSSASVILYQPFFYKLYNNKPPSPFNAPLNGKWTHAHLDLTCACRHAGFAAMKKSVAAKAAALRAKMRNLKELLVGKDAR